MYAFLEGRLVPFAEAKLGISTHAFLYGTACFEGIRAYWSEEESDLFIFRMQEHYERLMDSCKILRIKSLYTVSELCDLTRELLLKNGDHCDVYIRPIFYKSTETIGVKLTGLDDAFLLFAMPFGEYLDISKGLRVRVSSWRHLDDNAIPMRAKINGAYVNAALAKTEALDDGYDETIFLTNDGHVSEGSAENVFLVRKGRLVTTPATADILEGVTRATVLELASAIGIPVDVRQVDRTELYIADEIFLVGTGAQISPVTEVDHRQVGDGMIGPISTQMQELYFSVVRGQTPEFRHWCTPVFQA